VRPTGSRTPESRCFVKDKRPLCQLSSKHLEDNWHSGLSYGSIFPVIVYSWYVCLNIVWVPFGESSAAALEPGWRTWRKYPACNMYEVYS